MNAHNAASGIAHGPSATDTAATRSQPAGTASAGRLDPVEQPASTSYVTEIIEWYRHNQRDLPWRAAGFPAWGVLISEFMLQQTPVVRVIPRLAEWLERWPTPAALAAEPAGEAVRAWQSLGYPRRALNLHACAVAITERHGGTVPADVTELLALPGVGDYTARAVAVFAYQGHHPVVDTNTRRVMARSVQGLADQEPPHSKRDLAAMLSLMPERPELSTVFNAGMMELGAIVCTARRPECDICPISHRCTWKAHGFPATTGKVKKPQKKFEGSDRQVRGLILAELRKSTDPLGMGAIDVLWPDQAQRSRAIEGLLKDGLVVAVAGPATSIESPDQLIQPFFALP
jgi:A/G-specific adenine glycosylase